MNRKTALVGAAILSAACLLTVLFNPRRAYAASEAREGADIFGVIDAYLQACAQNARIPALSVTIVDKDSVLFSESYGDCESPDTPFLLGSVSKSFTAVCIMQLVERGEVDLTADISTYLPDATDGERITVGQLLNHTSGLGEHQTLADYEIVNEQGVHVYANVNYSLLGKIIEAVSGQSYSDYVTENVFTPLGLSRTAATLAESEHNGLIDGCINYWGLHLKSAHRYPESEDAWITVPAGYISSSTNDLGRYLQMYLGGGDGVISQQSIDTMFYGDTVYVDGDIPFRYGYGWACIGEPLSEPVLRHSGLVETGTSCVFILPERGTAVAVASNVNDYFVTNNMMDSLGWGVVLMLSDGVPNEIAAGAYPASHARIDLIMAAVTAASVLSLCLLPKYARGIKQGKGRVSALLPVLLDWLFASFIVLLVPIFFGTPLWVARAFVPDVFITAVVSAALFFAGGLLKGVALWRDIVRKKGSRGS